jgi:hypothetical protein
MGGWKDGTAGDGMEGQLEVDGRVMFCTSWDVNPACPSSATNVYI